MRKLRVWSMTAILGLTMAANSVAVAGDEEPNKPSRSWFGRLFAGPQKEIDIIEEAAEATTNKNARPASISREAYEAKEAEKQAIIKKASDEFLRREKVVDRLMQHAMESGDPELAKRLEALYDRAWNIYQKKSGMIPVVGSASAKTEPKGVKP
jgi:hypothetical protein